MSRRFGTVAGTLLTALSIAVVGSTPAHALTVTDAKTALTTTNYVALGDSFAAGTGDGTYGTSGSCYRSLYAYPVVDSTASGTSKIDATFVACSGATTGGIPGQLTAAGMTVKAEDVKYVSLTIGGNDAGFADAMKTCLGSGDCTTNATFTQSVAAKTSAVTDMIAANMTAIRANYSGAQIVVTGYPKLFQIASGKSSCAVGSLMTMTSAETTFLDQAAVALNAKISKGVAEAGAKFVDPNTGPNTFIGHGLCLGSTKSWINSLNLFNRTGAFHPNKTGQANYAATVAAGIDG